METDVLTSGARLDDGTELELDLSEVEDAPEAFRSPAPCRTVANDDSIG